MLQFFVLGCLVSAAFGGVVPIHDLNERIVGGEEVPIESYPWQVAMLRGSTSFSLSCGGSIIAPNVILTAAHCPYRTQPSQWRIRAGSAMSASGGQLVEVSRIVIHESYTGSFDYDVALMFLAAPIAINSQTTAVVDLPTQDQVVPDGLALDVTGWGTTREGGSVSPTLRKVTIPVVNQDICNTAYTNRITPRMLCAGDYDNGGKDACQGDSGGPLTDSSKVIIGITSWGNGCARPRFPGVNARVPALVNWINAQMNE